MLETIMPMFKLTWRNWRRLWVTCVRILCLTRHCKDYYYSREIDDFDNTVFEIYCSICVPKSIKIEPGLTRLVIARMKWCSFFDSQCRKLLHVLRVTCRPFVRDNFARVLLYTSSSCWLAIACNFERRFIGVMCYMWAI